MLCLETMWAGSGFFRVNGMREFLQFLLEKCIWCWVDKFNFLFVGIGFDEFLNLWRYRLFKVSALVFAVGLGLFGFVESSDVKIPHVRIEIIFSGSMVKKLAINGEFMVQGRRKCGVVMSEGLELVFTRDWFLLWQRFHYFILYFSSDLLTLLSIWKSLKLLFC